MSPERVMALTDAAIRALYQRDGRSVRVRKLREWNLEREPINWGDFGCVAAKRCCECGWVVWLRECGESENLRRYLTTALRANGVHLCHVVMEW